MRPRQAPPRLSAALERAHRAGILARGRPGCVQRRRGASSLAQPSTRRLPPGSTARAAVTCSTFSNSPARPSRHRVGTRDEAVIAGVDVPAAVVVALAEETGLLSDDARLVLQGAAVAGDPFEPDLAAPPRRSWRWWRWKRLMSCCASILFVAPRCRAGSGSATRWCVERCTSRRRRHGDSVRTPDALTCWPPAGLRRPNGRTISSTRRHKATRWRSPRCAKPVRWPRSRHRRAPPPGSVKHFASSRTQRRRSCVSSCSWPGPGCLSRQASSTTATTPCSSLSLVPASSVVLRVLTSACAGVEHLLGHHDQAHARLARRRRRSRRSTITGDSSADDRPGDGSLRRHGLPIDAPVGRDRFERLPAARRSTADFAAAAAVGVSPQQPTTPPPRRTHVASRPPPHRLPRRPRDRAASRRRRQPRRRRALPRPIRRLRTPRRTRPAVARVTGQSEFIPLADSIRGQVELLRGKLVEAGDVLDGATEAARLSGNVQALAGNLTNRSLTALTAETSTWR